MKDHSRQYVHGALKDDVPAQDGGEGVVNTYTQGLFNANVSNSPDPSPDLLSMDASHAVTYDLTSGPPSNNNPVPFLGRTFVHVAGPSQSSSRRGLQESFDFTTGHVDCFRDPAEPKMWFALPHDKQETCLVQEGNPHLPPHLSLAFVTAILAILKTTLDAVLAAHPSQLPQSASAVEAVLDRIQPEVENHLQSTSMPDSTVHILCDIPLLERRIHEGMEMTVQGLITLEFYRAPERKTTTWHRRSALKVMNVPWYMAIELEHKYVFPDKAYSLPIINTDAPGSAVQEPTLESASASNDLDAFMDQDIGVSASSTQPASHLVYITDDVLMADISIPCFEVTGPRPFPPVPSRCVSLELGSEKWAFLEAFHSRGTPEPMLPGSLPSTSCYNETSQLFHAATHPPAIWIPQEQLLHSAAIHDPTHVHERCCSPENTNISDSEGDENDCDENEDEYDEGDHDEDDSSLETTSTTGSIATEAPDNDSNDTGTNIDSDDDGSDEAPPENEADTPSQLPQQGARTYPCPFPGCTRRPFSRNGNMKTHLKTHEGATYQCEVELCFKWYRRPGDRKRHMDIDHKGEIWSCLGCNKKLNRNPTPVQKQKRCPKADGCHDFQKTGGGVDPVPIAAQVPVHVLAHISASN
ncbi:hypothetical protein BGW39_011696 [Mortierella sp. 14UC]|nr:hypothetical protein BGW39_011696 [Mortierella sp. 14UC]